MLNQETAIRVPEQVYFHRDACRLCGSHNVKLAVPLESIPVTEKYGTTVAAAKSIPNVPIDIYLCEDCRGVQILDVIDPEYLWSSYTYWSGQTAAIVDHFEEVVAEIIGRYALQAADGLVVDVGSNDGSLLKRFKARDFQVLGVDPATEVAKYACSQGVETYPVPLTLSLARQIRAEKGSVALVTAFNVFAHSDDMMGLGQSISELMGSQGLFVFEVQYLQDIIDKNLLGTVIHEHLNHYSVTTLIRFLHQFDLEVIHIKRVSIQKGSIIGVAQRCGGRYGVDDSVPRILKTEETKGLATEEALKSFDARVNAMKRDVNALLDGLGSPATFVGYGAARSGPTLMYSLGIENRLQCLLDDHPQKVGRFSPGNGLLVEPTSRLMDMNPTCAVMLAYIHYKTIIKKHLEYLESGGSFLLVYPKVALVTKDNVGEFLKLKG
jgi:hypothetical protein